MRDKTTSALVWILSAVFMLEVLWYVLTSQVWHLAPAVAAGAVLLALTSRRTRGRR